MAYTGNPSTDNKDALRLLIGDVSTSTSAELLSDSEAQYFLDTEGSLHNSAAAAARAISFQFAQEADKKVGDLRLNLSDRAENYEKLSKQLARRGRILADPVMPARSITDKDAAEDDSDRVSPSFARGQWDHPDVIGASEPDSTST